MNPTVAQAIQDVEDASTALANADTAAFNAASAVTAAQQKLDAAGAAKTQSDSDDTAAAVAYNAKVDALIGALTTSKRTVS